MTTGLHELREEDLRDALEGLLTPRLASLLQDRAPGHCLRVTDVDSELAARLCRRLRSSVSNGGLAVVVGAPGSVPPDVGVTSTKLVELRNPEAGGSQRPPLLAFVPPGMHASAEDSFGVATFEQLELGDVYDDLARRLLSDLPEALRRSVTGVFVLLSDQQWPYADSRARARYLLTVTLNDADPEAAGAALFELGLVPDFDVFTDPDRVGSGVARNLRHARTLTVSPRPIRQRVIELGLTDPAFRARLAEFLADAGAESPRSWARKIVIDRANWPLAFQHWPLRDDTAARPVRIDVAEPALPRAGDDPGHLADPVLRNLTGQLYLPSGSRGAAQLPVTFEVSPEPRQVAGLASFSVQLVSETSGSTGVVANVRAGATSRTAYRATLKKLRSAGLESGWHFIRVVPRDADGVPLPVQQAPRDGHPACESERFFVAAGGEADDQPEQRARRDVGLTQALRQLQFAELAEGRDWPLVRCRSVGWKGGQAAGRSTLEAVVGGHGAVEVPLAPALCGLERQILAAPELTRSWRLPVRDGRPEDPLSDISPWPPDTAEPVAVFRAARRDVLSAIGEPGAMVAEGRDLCELRHAAQAYAEAYAELLAWQAQRCERANPDDLPALITELTSMLQLDTATVDADGLAEAVLVAPTHPLRLLWLVTWAELGRAWLTAAAHGAAADAASASETLRHGLSPLGFPFVVPRSDGRVTVAAGDLTPYWGVCLPTDIGNPQQVMSSLAAMLKLPEHRIAGGATSGRAIADRVQRYLRLHPYVTTLMVSAINPGRAEPLADMLLDLQRQGDLADTCYDIQLFAADPAQAGTGQALAELLRGEWSAGLAAGAYCAPAVPGGTPKLAVALRPIAEFRSADADHTAHLTLLFDAFGGELLDTGPGEPVAVAPIHGLAQDVSVTYAEDEAAASWRKQPRYGTALPIPGAEELTDLLSTLPAMVSGASAVVATGQAASGQLPRITLSLDAAHRALLHEAHQASDWVVVIDRTLGVEYFDNPHGPRRHDYVIDYVPQADNLGHHIVVSSRSPAELRALIGPAMAQHGFDVEPRHVATFFDHLRLLSGRLAFKLASSTASQRTEILGLALARLYLDYQGALVNQVVVPLDSHLDLYRADRQRAAQADVEVGLRRTDLALFGLDARRKTITCRLVEVKAYSSLAGLSDYQQLKDRMAAQIRGSEAVIADRFDPDRNEPDRLDRTVLNAQLATLLRYYLGRAARHGVMRADAAAEARWLLDRLDLGYSLEFTRTGLLLDLARDGTATEFEGGVEFHRVGRDHVRDLLDAIPTDLVPTPRASSGSGGGSARSSTQRLETAAFREPRRAHDIPEDDPESSPPEGAAGAVEVTPEPPSSPSGRAPAEAASLAGIAAAGAATTDARGPLAHMSALAGSAPAHPDVFVGVTRPSPQYGILGEAAGRVVALDLNETHTISMFGVQGGGKSYSLGSVIEMATLAMPPLNVLPSPLATIVFHYSTTQDYPPEFTSMAEGNDDPEQVRQLRERYHAEPAGLPDVVMLVPSGQLDQRRAEYPGISVLPLRFSSDELRAEHWRFLMGAVGNQSTYIRQLQRIMRSHRSQLRLDVIRAGVDASNLPDHLKQLAQQRLDLAAEYIDDQSKIKGLVRPGRLIIVDLRDEFIEKDEALGLFVVLMQLFADAQHANAPFSKLAVFDEAHKYIDSPDLVEGLVSSVREMRHRGMSVLIASQDPPSVPVSLIELSDHVLLHKITSPAWLKHLQKANASLSELTPAKLASLAPGEAYLWASRATDPGFTRTAVKIQGRIRVTRHGGSTRTAAG